METHLKISLDTFKSLKLYLINHEHDIANGVNDYGDLIIAFNDIVGRQPEA